MQNFVHPQYGCLAKSNSVDLQRYAGHGTNMAVHGKVDHAARRWQPLDLQDLEVIRISGCAGMHVMFSWGNRDGAICHTLFEQWR